MRNETAEIDSHKRDEMIARWERPRNEIKLLNENNFFFPFFFAVFFFSCWRYMNGQQLNNNFVDFLNCYFWWHLASHCIWFMLVILQHNSFNQLIVDVDFYLKSICKETERIMEISYNILNQNIHSFILSIYSFLFQCIPILLNSFSISSINRFVMI